MYKASINTNQEEGARCMHMRILYLKTYSKQLAYVQNLLADTDPPLIGDLVNTALQTEAREKSEIVVTNMFRADNQPPQQLAEREADQTLCHTGTW
jgi:hypothetical protein